MNYKDYQQARDMSWKILLDCEVQALPVKITAICKRLDIAVYSYDKGRNLLKALGLEYHTRRTDGFTIYFDKPIIFYNSKLPATRCRFTIAHELGHILEGHIKQGQATAINREPDAHDNPQEVVANQFAARVLAPACVLWGLHIHRAEDIAKLCDISLQAANFRARRLEQLYQREQYFLQTRGYNCFLLSTLEKQVYAQFQEYINYMSASSG